MMTEALEGVVSGVVMLIVASLIMAVCYGVPYFVWRLWQRVDRVIQRAETKWYQWRGSKRITKPQEDHEAHEALRAAIRKQGGN